MEKTREFKVTNIKFYDYTHEMQVGENEYLEIKEYSADVTINDEFIVQFSGKENEAEKGDFAPSWSCYVIEKIQERAEELYDIDEIIDQIEKEGFENNYFWLSENADEQEKSIQQKGESKMQVLDQETIMHQRIIGAQTDIQLLMFSVNQLTKEQIERELRIIMSQLEL